MSNKTTRTVWFGGSFMWRKAWVISLVFLLLAGAGAFWYVRSQSFMATAAELLSAEATKALHTEIKIDKIHVRSLTEIGAENIEIFDKAGKVLAVAQQVKVSFSPLGMVRGLPTLANVSAVVVEQPVITLAQREDGAWNYQDLLSGDAESSNDFRGTVFLRDAALTVQAAGQSRTLQDLNGKIDFAAQPSLFFAADFLQEGGRAEISGTWGGARETVSVKAKDFDVAHYLDLLPENMAVQLNKGLLQSLDVTFLKNGSEYEVTGEAVVLGAALTVEETAVEDIDGLVLFNEKQLRIFSRGKVKQQPVVLRGTMSLDVVEPILDLQVSSKGFDAAKVLDNFPLHGKIAFAANIRGTYSAPTVEGVFDVKEGQLYDYTLQNLHAKLHFADEVLTVEEVSGALSDGRFQGEGRILAADGSYQLRLQAENFSVETFSAYLPDVSGKVRADLAIDGKGMDFADARVYGSAALQDGAYRNIPFTRLSANFYKQADVIDVDSVSLILPQGEVSAAGKIRDGRMDFNFSGGEVDLASIAQLEPRLKLSGRAGFSGTLSGTLAQPAVQATLTAKEGMIFDQPYQTAAGKLTLATDKIFMDGFTIKNGATEHRVSGFAGITGEKPVNLTAISTKARAEDIMKLALPGEALTGNIDNTVKITGTLDDLVAEGELDFYQGSFRGVLLTKAGGRYQWKDGQLQLKDFTVSAPNLRVKLNGALKADQSMDFDIIADEINFGKLRLNLPYPVSGMGKFAGKLSGNLDEPKFDGNLSADALIFNGQPINAVQGEIAYQNHALELTSFGFRQGNGTYRLTTGIDLNTKKIYGGLSVEKGDMAAILALFDLKSDWIGGELDGTIRLGGTVEKPRMHLQGSMGEGHLKDYPLRNIAIDITLNDRVITVKQFRAEQGEGLLVIKGTLDMAGPIALECAGQNIDAGLLTSLADYKMDTKGTLNFGAQVGGTVGAPTANLSLDIQGGGVGNATFDTLYGLFTLRDGIIQVEQLLAQKGEYKASAYGVIPLAALTSGGQDHVDVKNQMDLKVSLDQADLSILPLLTDQLDWAMGETKGGINITGTLAHPLVNGAVTIKEGAMKFKALGKPLQNLSLDVQFLGDRLELREFQGEMGSGFYRMSGKSRIGGDGVHDYAFDLKLDQLEIVNDYYKGPLSGTLTLTEDKIFEYIVPKLSGTLQIENSTLDVPSLPESEEAMPRVKLDLEVALGRKVRLYNSFLYDIWLEGHANFGGSTRRPQTSGEIVATRGTVNYLKTSFKIKEARAYFNQVNSFLPSLHLEADTRLQRTRVYLQIDGPADKMQIRLRSDPSMNESEILSLLTLRSRYFDKDSQGDSGIGKDELVSLLDIGLQMSFLSEVENMMRNALGVDEFKVVRDTLDLGSGRNSSEEVYNIEIGKYVDDKLMLRYVQGVDYDSYKFGIRYEFNSRISLTGDVDEDNNSTIGIEARFKF